MDRCELDGGMGHGMGDEIEPGMSDNPLRRIVFEVLMLKILKKREWMDCEIDVFHWVYTPDFCKNQNRTGDDITDITDITETTTPLSYNTADTHRNWIVYII